MDNLITGLLLMVVFLEGTYSYTKPEKYSQLDNVRNQILDDIQILSKSINSSEWKYIATRRGGPDGQVVYEFKQYCDKMDTIPVNPVHKLIVEQLWSWSVFDEHRQAIDGLWASFRQLQDKINPALFSSAWKKLAQVIIEKSPQLNIEGSMRRIHEAIMEEDSNTIFDEALQESRSHACQINQSPQQFLHNLYSSLQITQLRAYIMMQFSWMMLRIYENGNFTNEAEEYRRTFLERATLQAEAVKNSMEASTNGLWKCDPVHHIPGETYTELTRFLQGFVINEVDMNGDNTCRENCPYYKFTRQHGCYKDQFCNRQPPCTGNIVNCQFVDSDMWICQANSSSIRRYEYVEYENGRILGQKQSCPKPTTKVDSWWRWLFWHCSYCMCLCDDPKHQLSDRYFNLRPTISDMANNKVVTGIKFVKKNRIIHLQIQQGKLQERGAIDPESVEWVPVDNYQISDPNVKGEIDYHMMVWNQRALDLDDLFAPKNYVITGVRFRKLGTHLNLEIQASMFNFTSGELINGGKSEWIGNDNTDVSDHPRSQLNLYRPDVSTRTIARSYMDSTSDQYLEFTSTDLDKDAAQSAVPFIDTQAVAPEPSMPLSGIGLAHKGQTGFGGFVILKVFTLDLVDHIQDTFTSLNEA